MATDATGTPTSLGIPKYNTSADAPSGLGFNAAMDAIDALIAARVTKPSGIASGEAPVWNGSGWDRSTVTKIGRASLDFGSGLVNADLAVAAALAQSKIAFDAFQTYTPAWTTSGTAPSLGNGSTAGRYTQIGKTVIGFAQLTMGSTTTFGTGTYALSLPVNIQNGTGIIGSVVVHDASPANDYIHAAIPTGSGTIGFISHAAPGVFVTNVAPITFAVNDFIFARFVYEAQ